MLPLQVVHPRLLTKDLCCGILQFGCCRPLGCGSDAGLVIASRYPIKAGRFKRYDLATPYPFSSHHGYLAVDLDVGEKLLRVVNTHPSFNVPVESLRILANDDALAQTCVIPTIVGGDFNAMRNGNNPDYESSWTGVFKALEPLGFTKPGENDLLARALGGPENVPATYHDPDYDFTAKPAKGKECIDYINANDLCLQTYVVKDTKILKIRGQKGKEFPMSREGDVSDHYGITTTLYLKTSNSSGARR